MIHQQGVTPTCLRKPLLPAHHSNLAPAACRCQAAAPSFLRSPSAISCPPEPKWKLAAQATADPELLWMTVVSGGWRIDSLQQCTMVVLVRCRRNSYNFSNLRRVVCMCSLTLKIFQSSLCFLPFTGQDCHELFDARWKSQYVLKLRTTMQLVFSLQWSRTTRDNRNPRNPIAIHPPD